MTRCLHPLAHRCLEFVRRHAGMRGGNDRNERMVAARKHSFDVARQQGFEGLFVLPFRVSWCQDLEPIQGEGNLKRIGLRPQCAV